MRKLINQDKGFSHILLVAVLALGILATVGYKVFKDKGYNTSNVEEAMMKEDLMEKHNEVVGDFEDIEEPEGTPEEIDNASLDELDALILDIESDALTEDDISSL